MLPLRQGWPIRRNARGHARSWQRFLTSGSNVALVLVRWLYVGSLVLIAAVTLFAMLMSWWLAS
jgi:Flp pilus assembly protein TadB